MAESYDKIRTAGLDCLKAQFGEQAVERAVELVSGLEVEIPGWQFWAGFGGGGRFDESAGNSAARNIEEIAEDAAVVQRLTRSTPAVGMHVLWFLTRDGVSGDLSLASEVAGMIESKGLRMGSISPTYFIGGAPDGSLSAADEKIRARFVEQTVLAAKIAAEYGNGVLSLWFPDGTNYPGQRSLREKISFLAEGLNRFWETTPLEIRSKLESVLVEYKLFEPGTYSTTVADWGTALELSRIFGDKGGVLVDLGHHAHGTNIEQIIANLLWIGVRCGMHFNTRYSADDDHSVQADYPLARIFYELLSAGVLNNKDDSRNWPLALDQMARTEQRIPSVLKSVDALMRTAASAALVDFSRLDKFQSDGDLIAANVEFERALLHADTGAILMEANDRKGLHPVPLDAYIESGYQKQIDRARF